MNSDFSVRNVYHLDLVCYNEIFINLLCQTQLLEQDSCTCFPAEVIFATIAFIQQFFFHVKCLFKVNVYIKSIVLFSIDYKTYSAVDAQIH